MLAGLKSLINIGISFVVIYVLVCAFLYFKQEMLIFPARKIPQDFNFPFNADFEEVFLDTPDGERIHGIYFSSPEPKGVILSFHGNGETAVEAGYEALEYLARGYDVLVTDYRSYGKSGGKLSEQNLFNDAKQFYDFLVEKGWHSKEIIIYGRSIGTGIALHLATRTDPQKVILLTPYFSLLDLSKDLYSILPISTLLRYPIRSDLFIKDIDVPIFIFHGTNDRVVPYKHGKRLSEEANITENFITIKGGEHNNLLSFPYFWERMKTIIE